MSENDTDIDFDFFEDEPPTQETSRTERLIPRRGPRGPGAAAPPPGPARARAPPARADHPGPAAAPDRLDRLRDPDRRPARDLGAELPGVEQGQDVQELHGEGLGRVRLVAANRQAAQPGAARAGVEGGAGRAARRRPRTPGAARRPARPCDHAAGDAA